MSKKRNQTVYQRITETPLGDMRLACTQSDLIGAWFTHEQRHAPHCEKWVTDDQHPVLLAASQQLSEYFLNQRNAFELPLTPAWGTAFQKAVWANLRNIPHGQTCTYGDLAQRLGKPNAVRAVGAAIGRNPHSIFVPCHRVLGSDGKLVGYAGGLDRKRKLLERENKSK